jgi:hypothetical protein
LITHSDDGPDHDRDDPLAVILRPSTEYLGAPPGRYEAVRRRASRRRLLRAAAGAAVTCGVAALIVLPLRLTASDGHGSPTVPLAPPPAGSPSTLPQLSPSPVPRSPHPSQDVRTTAPPAVPTARASTGDRSAPSAPADSSTPSVAPTREPSGQPSATRTRSGATPTEASTRP